MAKFGQITRQDVTRISKYKYLTMVTLETTNKQKKKECNLVDQQVFFLLLFISSLADFALRAKIASLSSLAIMR